MSHSRRTPCCESEAIRYLQEETLLTTGKEGAWFTEDSLAAAYKRHCQAQRIDGEPVIHVCGYDTKCAAAINQAAKEGGS